MLPEIDTLVIKINSEDDMDKLDKAAEILRNGGLVAFPTETVYGLGANAMDEAAVKKIFRAKGRPSDNPLIVHVTDKSDVKPLVKSISLKAESLMDRFWPGPLTLIMPKSDAVPYATTAGLDTVAIRMPSHKVARELIRRSGVPIAAPSANISGKPSPTDAKHVINDMMGRVDVIIDAGCVQVGLESTVVDISSSQVTILRPGAVTAEQLEAAAGNVLTDPAILKKDTAGLIPKAPGMKYKHYSPEAEVIIVKGDIDLTACKINELAADSISKNKKIGIMATTQTRRYYDQGEVIVMGDRDKPSTIAANLFACLREFDRRKVDVIFTEAIDTKGIGAAVMNRMNKAAGYNIIKV